MTGEKQLRSCGQGSHLYLLHNSKFTETLQDLSLLLFYLLDSFDVHHMKRWQLIIGSVLTGHHRSQAFLIYRFNTTYFGPDGPWQALVTTVFYRPTERFDILNLYPNPVGDFSWIPTREACSSSCVAGAARIPAGPSSNLSFAPYGLAFDPWVNTEEPYNQSNGYFWSFGADVAQVDLSLGDLATTTSIPNNTIAAVWSAGGYYTNDDDQLPIPGGAIGFLSLASYNSNHATNALIRALCPGDNCNHLRYLYHSNEISSLSFGMHIGSASLDFPGSLILGGFDRGRAIGDTLDWLSLQLLDVRLGVETGGSPFEFGAEKPGLLKPDNSEALPLPSYADTTTPYIFLPHNTVDAITNVLPVYYDESSRYFLWDASNPSYAEIVQSPAYLGFDFLKEGGSTTIKVPLMLLNLTLEPEASGLDHAVPYFPILPQTHSGSSLGAQYPLGRAFLQATFMGTNWGQNATWLAQAPGPGADKQGLGIDLKDIDASETFLDLATSDDLFNESWKGVWTPLPVSKSNVAHEDKGLHGGGLSGGEIAGVVVGVVGFLGIATAICAFLLKRRKPRQEKQPKEDPVEDRASEQQVQTMPELSGKEKASELPVQTTSELSGKEKRQEASSEPVHEMSGDTGAQELWSSNARN